MGVITLDISGLIIAGLVATVITMLLTAVVEYILIVNKGMQNFFFSLLKVGAIVFWPVALFIIFFT